MSQVNIWCTADSPVIGTWHDFAFLIPEYSITVDTSYLAVWIIHISSRFDCDLTQFCDPCSEAVACSEWTDCQDNDTKRHTPAGLCRFRGDGSKKIVVKLSKTTAPLSRTFYTPTFTVNNSSK